MTKPQSVEDGWDATGWSASLYNSIAPFVYSQAATLPVLELLSVQPGEKIVDFGCGSGELTLQIERDVKLGGGGLVIGVDSSESMITKAKQSGLYHALVADIQAFEFPDHIALVQTRPYVLESAKKILKPGGRVVGEFGGFMNCVGVRSALHHVLRQRGYDPTALDPWYFPSVEEYTTLLTSTGFEPVHISLNPRLTVLPTSLLNWLHLFARRSFLASFSDDEAELIMKDVVQICEVDCKDSNGQWALMYMRLRFVAILDS